MTAPIIALTTCCNMPVPLESHDRFAKWVRNCAGCRKVWIVEKAGKRRDRRWKLEWRERNGLTSDKGEAQR